MMFVFVMLVTSGLAQQKSNQEKAIHLSNKAIRKRIIKQEFLNIPQGVRDCHVTGSFFLRLRVNQDGRVENAKLLTSGPCQEVNEYVEKAVSNWKFKPLKLNKRNVPFVGNIVIPFWYGGFGKGY
jgi:TonB family protein